MALVVKNLPAIRGDTSSIRGLGRSPGEGDGNPLQYSYLENSMNRGAWQATDREVGKDTTERLTLSFPRNNHCNYLLSHLCFGMYLNLLSTKRFGAAVPVFQWNVR